jgi:pentatricopeptide repeat protein
MNDVGCVPNVLHFTNLIDGLGHTGNLEAYRYFFDEMFWRVRMSIDVF